jgi:tetratricopeptide (TPR) repeat protein
VGRSILLLGVFTGTVFLGTQPCAAAQDAGPTESAGDVRSLLERAVVLQQAGDLDAAAALYEQALRRGADSPALRSNLGAAYAGLGRYEEATRQYGLALAADGSNAAARRNLALALLKVGRVADAAAQMERVVAAQPGSDAARLLLADCLFRLGRNAGVIQLLAPLAGSASAGPAVSYLLGMALLAEGRVAEAQREIDRVLRGGSPEARVLLAAMYAKGGDCARAEPEIRRALSGNPRVPLANFLDGQCRMEEGRNDWPGAMEAFRAELSVDPDHFESNLFLGTLLREEGRHEEALPLVERAARLRPGDAAAQFSQGAVYMALGRTGEALPLLEQVAAASPGHTQTWMQLAVAYHRLGRAADSARARAVVGRLQSEGENAFFEGVSAALGQLLGKDPAEDASPDPAR